MVVTTCPLTRARPLQRRLQNDQGVAYSPPVSDEHLENSSAQTFRPVGQFCLLEVSRIHRNQPSPRTQSSGHSRFTKLMKLYFSEVLNIVSRPTTEFCCRS
jgi:hypothetical protein